MKSLERLRTYARTFTGTTKHEIEHFADDIACEVERVYVKREVHDEAIRLKLIDIGVQRARANELESERDEWKAKCSELTDKIGEITDEGSELMKKQPYTFDVHDVPGSLRTVGRYIDELKSRHCPNYHADRHYCDVWETRIKALIAERDEWKRKAKEEELNANGHWRNANNWAKQVDEWKAKAEAKSDKRAAAAERLRHLWNACVKDTRQLFGALVDKGAPIYAERNDFDALIDLLSDSLSDSESGKREQERASESAHSKAHSKTEQNLSEQSQSLSDEADSREKLEADIDAIVLCIENEAKQYAPSPNGYGTREKLDDLVRGLKARMLEVADRQEAITERECREEYESLCDGKHGGWSTKCFELAAKCDELQAKVDELTAEREAIAEAVGWETGNDVYTLEVAVLGVSAALEQASKLIPELQAKVDELEKRLAGNARHPFSETILASLDSRENELKLQERVEELERDNAKLSSDELHWRSEAKRLEGELKTQRNNFDQATGARDYWKEKLGILLKRLSDMGCTVGSINDVPIEVELPREDEGLA